MTRRSIAAALVSGLVLASSATAGDGTVVQTGALPGPGVTDIVLDQFDTQGGTRALDSVQLDFFTFFSGGYQTDGSGVAVDVLVSLTADYQLDATLLGETEARLEFTVPNTGPAVAVSFFDTDSDMTLLDTDLDAWIGDATITLTAESTFTIDEDPPGVIFTGAGGSAEYTVTYTYVDVAPCPADLDGNGSVGFADLTQLISAWGPCAGCPEDLDGNGSVGFADLTALLTGWGRCA